MSEARRRFLGSADGATSIEYALIGMGIALVVVLAVSDVGAGLAASFGHIAAAFP